MQVKLTIGERLKDLRVERKLTLEQLSVEVGISKSALGKYESDNGKDISPYSIMLLADYYGVSCDYLMGRTETKNHPNTALHELHLSDASIDVLRTGKFNHRLLSELICHRDFQRFTPPVIVPSINPNIFSFSFRLFTARYGGLGFSPKCVWISKRYACKTSRIRFRPL